MQMSCEHCNDALGITGTGDGCRFAAAVHVTPWGASVLCMKLRWALVDCLIRLADLYTSADVLLARLCMVPAAAMSDCCSSSPAWSMNMAGLR